MTRSYQWDDSCIRVTWHILCGVVGTNSVCDGRFVRHICNESCHLMNEPCRVCDWVTSHKWMKLVAHVNNESWHAYMIHVTHTNESCQGHCMGHVSQMGGSYPTWPMQCPWHDSFVCVTYGSCFTNEWVVSHMTHAMPLTWLICMCDMNHVCRIPHMIELCYVDEWVVSHMWMSLVAQMNRSCPSSCWGMPHIWLSHVARMHVYGWVKSHVCLYVDASGRTYRRIVSRIYVYSVICLNASYHTYKGCMLHIWMSHATHMNESCRAYEWVVSRIWMGHVTHTNESCHTYEWVMSHTWMSHVNEWHNMHINESCHFYEWVMSHAWIHHITHTNVLYHTYDHLCYTYERVTSLTSHERVKLHVCMHHVAHMNKSRHTQNVMAASRPAGQIRPSYPSRHVWVR